MSSEERVCFDKEGFVLFIESLRDAFGSAGEAMVFHMSKRYGSHIIQSAMSSYTGAAESVEGTMGKNMDRVKSLGWGDISFDEMDWRNGEFKISMTNNSFGEYCNAGQDSMCFFIKGVMTGTIEEITHQQFSINDLECTKKGGTKCQFLLKRID